MYKNLYGSIIHKNQELETTSMLYNDRMNKLLYIYKMEYCMAIKMNELPLHLAPQRNFIT